MQKQIRRQPALLPGNCSDCGLRAFQTLAQDFSRFTGSYGLRHEGAATGLPAGLQGNFMAQGTGKFNHPAATALWRGMSTGTSAPVRRAGFRAEPGSALPFFA